MFVGVQVKLRENRHHKVASENALNRYKNATNNGIVAMVAIFAIVVLTRFLQYQSLLSAVLYAPNCRYALRMRCEPIHIRNQTRNGKH